jgi:hypothetical protein
MISRRTKKKKKAEAWMVATNRGTSPPDAIEDQRANAVVDAVTTSNGIATRRMHLKRATINAACIQEARRSVSEKRNLG